MFKRDCDHRRFITTCGLPSLTCDRVVFFLRLVSFVLRLGPALDFQHYRTIITHTTVKLCARTFLSRPVLTNVAMDPWDVSDEERASSDEFPRHRHDEWSDDEADPMTNPIATNVAFLDLILGLNLGGAWSAKMVRQLCFWAAKAGACGRIGEFGLPPNEQTGKYNAHLSDI